jgi:hypothetical protein
MTAAERRPLVVLANCPTLVARSLALRCTALPCGGESNPSRWIEAQLWTLGSLAIWSPGTLRRSVCRGPLV